jgi:hypothetical protein
MKTETFGTSTCRCCHHYKPEGRRGGTCQQLGVPVRGCWKACSLGMPAFARYLGHFEEDVVHLEHSLSLDYVSGYSEMEISGVEELSPSQAREVKAA